MPLLGGEDGHRRQERLLCSQESGTASHNSHRQLEPCRASAVVASHSVVAPRGACGSPAHVCDVHVRTCEVGGATLRWPTNVNVRNARGRNAFAERSERGRRSPNTIVSRRASTKDVRGAAQRAHHALPRAHRRTPRGRPRGAGARGRERVSRGVARGVSGRIRDAEARGRVRPRRRGLFRVPRRHELLLVVLPARRHGWLAPSVGARFRSRVRTREPTLAG